MRMVQESIPPVPSGDDCDSMVGRFELTLEKETSKTICTDLLPRRKKENSPLPTSIMKPCTDVKPLDFQASLMPLRASPFLSAWKADRARCPKTRMCSPSGMAQGQKMGQLVGGLSAKPSSPSEKASANDGVSPSRVVLASRTSMLSKTSVSTASAPSGSLLLRPNQISGPSPLTAGTPLPETRLETRPVSCPCAPLPAEKEPKERRPPRPLKTLDKSLKELQVNAMDFYANYCGHPLEHLLNIYEVLKYKEHKTEIIWLLGDGSIDNKHWLYKMHKRKLGALHHEEYTAKAINGFEHVLVPLRMVQDIAYHINAICAQEAPHMCCLNTAVENSTLAERSNPKTMKQKKRVPVYVQDLMCRDLLTSRDTLIVSIGGNDVAAFPSTKTIASICSLLAFGSQSAITAGTAVGMAHIIKLFKTTIEDYLHTIVIKTLPRRILVGMTYFLDDRTDYDAWVNSTLCKLGCKVDPAQLKCIIRAIFEHATKKIKIPGTEVIPVPLYETLNGSCSEDYETFVEPSVQGGAKLARSLFDCITRSEVEMCASDGCDQPTAAVMKTTSPSRSRDAPHVMHRSISEFALPQAETIANGCTERTSAPGGCKVDCTSGATAHFDADRVGLDDDGPKVAEEGSRLAPIGGSGTDKTVNGNNAHFERRSGWVGAAKLRKNFKFNSFARIRRMSSKSVAKHEEIL